MAARQMSPKVIVSVVYVVAMFMTIMDTTIVNVALHTILPRAVGPVQGSDRWQCRERLGGDYFVQILN